MGGALCAISLAPVFADPAQLPPAPVSSAHRLSVAAVVYSLVGVTTGAVLSLAHLRDQGPLFLFVWLYYSARMLFRIGHTLVRFFINRSETVR
jgi:hypothetical protein